MKLDTLAVHAGQHPDPTTGAVMPNIVLSSTFAQDGPGEHKGYDYSRSGNPTRNTLEACIAALEGGAHGLSFGSGLGATTTILHLLRPGDHVVCGDDVYGGTFRILDKCFKPLGIDVSFVDFSDPSRLEAALQPNTKLVWLETPTNPTLKVFDIAALAAITRPKSIPLVVDNTFATPVIQRPLALGADIVLHSVTKYLNGHSDVVGGAIVVNDDGLHQGLRFLQNALGAVPSPFDCFMVLRGIKTLHLRVERASASALSLAQWLESHPDVRRVHYPGLPSHPNHSVAQRQMALTGGMISFVISPGKDHDTLARSRRFLKAVKLFACAESLGGVESLIEHPALMTHASVPAAQRNALGIDDGLIRVSVGVEHVEDLRADLAQAFELSATVR
ncbi:MAG: cystathionine gamma-synthase [Deltaproteobacteria bacterium]|nr:cystathionine gamma-synthase [Deltaproteobacteria bacterium]